MLSVNLTEFIFIFCLQNTFVCCFKMNVATVESTQAIKRNKNELL